MSQDIERAADRLENIRSVQPLLGALRTISMGSWQKARRHNASVARYRSRLQGILRLLLPRLPSRRRPPVPLHEPRGAGVVVLVIGSERGLVGQLNWVVAGQAVAHIRQWTDAGVPVELWALGGRVVRILRRQGREPDLTRSLSTAALPSYRLAFDLTRRLLTRFEAGELDGVDVVYNTYRGVGQYRPAVGRLIPPEISLGDEDSDQETWPPILETDPMGLYTRLAEQLTAISLYGWLVESATAEHAARYQLMEDASQNAERLIDELTMQVQMARRQAITQEMQELVAGAGLLASPGRR